MADRPFYLLIQDEVKRHTEQSDDALLKDLVSLAPLPDEYVWFGITGKDNPAWAEPESQQNLISFLAMADLIAVRKLRPGVKLLLGKASYGDMGETMRGLRHSLEAAYNPDWDELTDVCIKAAQHERAGTRLWAICELGILRDAKALPVLFDAVYDRAHLVRTWAIHSLGMIIRAQDVLDPHAKRQLERIYLDIQQTQQEFRMLMEKMRDMPESSD